MSTLLTRSMPFCRPKLVTTAPNTTTTARQTIISPGLESMLPKTASTPLASMPSKAPVALFTV